jgi:MFS family permease
MSLWGRFADKYGNVKTMRISGFLTPIIPLLWFLSAFVVSTDHILVYLIVVEAFSGIAWAGFNLASANFVYDAVTRQRMAICITYDSITTTFGLMIGGLIGRVIASMKFNFFGINAILAVFLIGAIVRLMVHVILNPKFQEVREVKNFVFKEHMSEVKGKLKENLSLKKFFDNIQVSSSN